jgi:hypothetical protein
MDRHVARMHPGKERSPHEARLARTIAAVAADPVEMELAVAGRRPASTPDERMASPIGLPKGRLAAGMPGIFGRRRR